MSKISFTGRVAVVTGAGGGLGRAYSLALAARGASVVVNDLGGAPTGVGGSKEYADKVVDEIRAAGGKAVASYDTVATPAGGQAIIQKGVDAFGRIDIVVNNAGNQRNGPFEDMTEDAIEAVFAVHVKGAYFVTQPAYRLMKRQSYGRIVFTSSQSGIFGNPFRANYGSAKTAMIGLMNVIAQEAPREVVVNCLFPNAAGGRLSGKPGDYRVDAAFLAEAAKRVPRYIDGMQPDFVAAMLLYLVSDHCTTSQGMYSVLGGRYAKIFAGVPEGWMKAGPVPPTPEEIEAHLSEIADRSRYTTPLSGLDEMDGVVAALDRLAPKKS